jgi:hypothetical protein
MSNRLSRVLALVAALGLTSAALAQNGDTTAFDFSAILGWIGPVAAIIWLVLFTAWGGFRYIF